MTDNNQRKSASKSPPILLPEHLSHSKDFHEGRGSHSPPAAETNNAPTITTSTTTTTTTTITAKITETTEAAASTKTSTDAAPAEIHSTSSSSQAYSTSSSRILVSTTDLGFTKPPRHPSQNEERLASYIPLTQVTSSSESGASALHVNSSDLPSLNESPATLSTAPLPVNTLTQGTSSSQQGEYSLYHVDHPTQHIDALQFTQSESPSLGPQSLQALPEDVTEEEAGSLSFGPTPNKDGSFVDPNDSLSSSNKSSDSSFHKANRSSDSHHSSSSSKSNRSGAGVSPSGSNRSSVVIRHRSGSAYTSTPPGRSSGSPGTQSSRSSDSQMSQFSQVSNVSFAGIAHSTPREEPSQLSTPSNPSPGDSQISPLGTYSTAAGSQQYPTQDTQGPVRSPTINAQLSRQGIAQKINVVMYTRVTETATAVEHDDNATQPLDLFGPDPRPDDVEASFEEEEVSYTQGSSGPAPRNFAADDENAEVDEITSQDINSPFEATPSPAKPKGRTEDGDGEDVRGPAHVEYLSSDDDDASKLSVHDSTIHLHLTQDLSASNSSFPIQSLTRSRPASRTDADKILPPSTTRHGKLPESSQHLEEPIITQKPLDSQQPDDSSLPPSQTSLVEEPFTTSKRKPRSARSPRPSASQLEDVPSSQNSGSSLTGSSSYSRRMRPLEEEFKAELKADPKRRRVLSSDKPTDVPSSVEDEFWESSVTESQAKVTVIQEKRVSRTRSRPISQDTSSFPSGQLSQAENEDQPGLTDKGKSKAAEKDDTSDPSLAAGPSSRTRSATTPSKRSPKPQTNSPSQLRRRGSGRASASTTPTRRNPVRRLHSSVESLRSYRTNDRVWARWLKGRYWAGVIQDKIDNKYNVLFLDRNELDCEADELRPLKLQLGTEVMARKTAKKEYPAILEGVHTMREFAQSRLDIRFEDKTEANVALGEIYLTQEMMDKLDDHIDWDMDNLRAITGEQSSQSESIPSEPSTPRRSSSTSVPPSTPRKGKDRSELARYGSAAPLTPRRGRSEAVSSAEIITPTGSGKEIFKGLQFVVTLTDREDLYEGIKKKIVEGAGSIAEKFPQVIGRHPSDLQSNVVLISYTHLRSPKYFDALAMNVPRLSYRWVESCIKNHQLQSPQHYKLATGFSKELETVVSTEPVNDFGIFDGLEIGICGGTTAFMKDCKNRLKAAGAAVVKVTPEKGPMSCNFVVFSDTQQYTAYCKENTDIPPLSREWLYQCLINQRIMGINGHPSYTELEEVYQPETP